MGALIGDTHFTPGSWQRACVFWAMARHISAFFFSLLPHMFALTYVREYAWLRRSYPCPWWLADFHHQRLETDFAFGITSCHDPITCWLKKLLRARIRKIVSIDSVCFILLWPSAATILAIEFRITAHFWMFLLISSSVYLIVEIFSVSFIHID